MLKKYIYFASCVCVCPGSWADRSPLHEAASQGRLLALRTLLAQVTGSSGVWV